MSGEAAENSVISGSDVLSFGGNGEGERASFEYTEYLKNYLRSISHDCDEPGLSPDRRELIRHRGRPIITRDSQINGGVYLIGGSGEALVVDDSKNKLLIRTYKKLLSDSQITDPSVLVKAKLSAIYEMVRTEIPYSKDGVAEVDRRLGVGVDDKINLGVYIKNRVGVCRHQTLLVAYLLEKLIEGGHIKGRVSVDRALIKDKKTDKLRGHAWARFTDDNGEVYIIDIAKSYCGKLSDIKQHSWPYLRPDDNVEREQEKKPSYAVFILGEKLSVRRTSGQIDQDWFVHKYDRDNGIVIMRKTDSNGDIYQKKLRVGDLEKVNEKSFAIQDRILNTEDFDDLYDVIRAAVTLEGSDGYKYDCEELISIINSVREGRVNINHVSLKYGLRSCVRKLLKRNS